MHLFYHNLIDYHGKWDVKKHYGYIVSDSRVLKKNIYRNLKVVLEGTFVY